LSRALDETQLKEMTMLRLRLSVIMTVVLAGAVGCSDDANPGSGADAGVGGSGSSVDAVSFDADIHPILNAKCSGGSCHSRDQGLIQPGHGADDVDDAYAATQLITTAAAGGRPAVRVYNRIVARGSGSDPFGWMPPNPPCVASLGAEGCLTQEELTLIEMWVAQGAPR
jgi:hypothetical protein